MELLALILLAVAAWAWYDTMRAREVALRVGRAACARREVQFLDDTVSVVAIGFKRDPNGRLAILRRYRFEFSDTGNNRLSGAIVLLGAVPERVHLESPPADDELPRVVH